MAPSAGAPQRDEVQTTNSVEHEEHATNLLRFRKAAYLGSILWVGFVGVDVFSVDGRWSTLARVECYRAIPLAMAMVALLRLRTARVVSPAELMVWQTSTFALANATLALMALALGTISNPYGSGAILVLMADQLVSTHPWRRALGPTLIIGAAYPLMIVGVGLLRPDVAAELANKAELKGFLTLQAGTLGAVVMLLVGGHNVWALRRKVYAKRALGAYRLLERIGAGGMGEVWAAERSGLHRKVALKIVRPTSEDREVSLARFEREVRAMTGLSHPNTVRVYDYGITDDGLRYYAMELLDGLDLGHLLMRDGPLSPARAVKLVLQAARALAEAHAQGIVHRDIKPENLFVATVAGDPDVVKVLDFGIARGIASDVGETLTASGIMVGTPRYMAPELFLGERPTPAADVYALGAVLYFVLAGRPPFEQREASELLAAHHGAVPVPPSRKRGESLPAELEDIVARCLAKDRRARFPDAGALAQALADVLPRMPEHRFGAGERRVEGVEAPTVPSPRITTQG